jgi:hypothetical protein
MIAVERRKAPSRRLAEAFKAVSPIVLMKAARSCLSAVAATTLRRTDVR